MIKFLLLKYVSLALQSLRALLLAALLGPVSYGMLGTLVLIQQYLSYAALGVREGLAVKLAHADADEGLGARICSSAILWSVCVGAVILCIASFAAISVSPVNLNWIWVGVIASLSVTNEMYININRHRNRILRVAILDIMFNLVPFCAVLIYFREITMAIALKSLALGQFISVALYAVHSRGLNWRSVSGAAIRQLIVTGIPLALMSFVMTSLTAIFVFSANAMHLHEIVGQVVFANSICLVLLFGLNMAAWAATSKSMTRLHLTNSDRDLGMKRERLTIFFRLGVVCSAGSLLFLKVIFSIFMTQYAGSEVFAIYFCLLQSYGLLLYREVNFLAVRSKSYLVALSYSLMVLVIVATAVACPSFGLVGLVEVALLLMFLFSFCLVAYCKYLGFGDPSRPSQLLFLAFPVFFAFGFLVANEVGAGVVALAYAALGVRWYRHDLEVLLTGVHH